MEQAMKLIEAQQKKLPEGSAPWVVGEQLKDICRRESASAQLIAEDLQNESMSLVNAEKRIKAYADKHKVGNFAYVSPQKAEEILREFYGLPAAATPEEQPSTAVPSAPLKGGSEVPEMIDLGAFF